MRLHRCHDENLAVRQRGVNFACAQLGGASCQNATITAPHPPLCRPQKTAVKEEMRRPIVGTVDVTQQAYGAVTYPARVPQIAQMAMWRLAPAINGPFQTGKPACATRITQLPKWFGRPDCGGVLRDPSSSSAMPTSSEMHFERCPPATPRLRLRPLNNFSLSSCPNRGIKDLTGLEQFALTSLDLTANQLTKFSLPLSKLGDLKIGYNQLLPRSMSQLYGGGPIRVDASNNQLKTMIGTASVYFEVLDISHNQFSARCLRNRTLHGPICLATI